MRQSRRFAAGTFGVALVAMALPVGARDLTIDERVKAQEAIERVYYAHQLGTTKPFEQVVPRASIERKVRLLKDRAADLTSGERFTGKAVTSSPARSQESFCLSRSRGR